MKFKKLLLLFLVLIVGYISFEIYTSEYEFSTLVGGIVLGTAITISNFFEATSDFFNNITTSYPLICLIVLFAISLLILYLILKHFFKKQKILLSFILIIILTLIFIRTIPDYSNKYGISLTTIFGKEKYKQGYCLKENRILPKEELYKRVATQYLEKYKAINRKVTLIENDCEKDAIKYHDHYIDENFTIDNWEEYLKTNIGSKGLFSLDSLKLVDYKKYFKVDSLENTAGFNKPILYFDTCRKEYRIFLDQSFTFIEDGVIINLMDFDNERSSYGEKNIKDAIFYINIYKDGLKNRTRYIKKIDNCGNVDYDIDKRVKDIVYSHAHGGL